MSTTSPIRRVAALAAIVAATLARPAAAAPVKPAAPAVAAPAPAAALPPPPVQGVLIQTALAALNQANLADDYTVLVKNAARSFQRSNTPQQLSQRFRSFRDAHVDLSPVMLYVPRLTAAPTLRGTVLHMVGIIPSQPMQTSFDLFFEAEDGRYRLAGLSAGLVAPKLVAQSLDTALAP